MPKSGSRSGSKGSKKQRSSKSSPETKIKVCGGKAIRLNDQNQLGGGNAEKIINAYIARHKKRRGTKKRSLL